MSVAQAQAEIDSREFAEWIAFDRIEPFGEPRADLRSAIVASTVANAFRSGGRPLEAKDFMPRFDAEASPPQTADEIQNLLFTFAAAHNQAIRRRN